jgi:hypothetical protein
VRTPLPGNGNSSLHSDAASLAPSGTSIVPWSGRVRSTAALSELDALAGLDAARLDKFFQSLGLD